MITYKQLIAWRQREVDKVKATGAPMFLLLPDAWYEMPHWFCENGHVSLRFLRSEGSDRCLACGKAVVIGPPELSEWDFQLICRGIAGGKEV
jgi:hypothetical protein